MLANPDSEWEDRKYEHVAEHIRDNAPEEEQQGYDHVPNLLTQLSREPLDQPELNIADKPLDALEYDDFTLRNYDSHPPLTFEVAE